MYIKATKVGAAGPTLYPMRRILKVKRQGSGAIIVLKDGDSDIVSDSLASIVAQQTGKTIGFIFVIETQKPNAVLTSAQREILLPTHCIREIYTKGTGAQINMEDGMGYVVENTVANIAAQQAAPTNLGLLLVTRTEDSEQYIVGVRHVLEIQTSGAGALILVKGRSTQVNQSVNTLQGQIN